MSKEEIVQAIRACAKQLKHNPSRRDLRQVRISEDALYKHFGGLRKALEEAGLEPSGSGFRQPEAMVLLDWARVARKLGKIPTVHEYESAGRFSDMPFHSRYGNWTRVPEAFRGFATKAKIQGRWKDVLEMIAAKAKKSREPKETPVHHRMRRNLLQKQPVYGPLLNLPELVHEPLNEQGVIFAFGVAARRLGFAALRFQTAFPDCEALREVVRGQLQRVRIEFEYESRNFLKHRHRKDGCDIIVCWVHNWKECPKNIQVIELRKILKNL